MCQIIPICFQLLVGGLCIYLLNFAKIASQSMQSQVRNPGQLQISLANQSLAWQQLLSQKIQNDIANPGIQGPRSWSQIRTNHSNIESNMDATDWKTLLQPESRTRIVTKMVEILKRHLPFTGPEGLVELDKLAVRFEEKIFTAAAASQVYHSMWCASVTA